jgi:hypothetical protein
MRQFVGITRERVFSPGRVADDAAILHCVAERLRADGHAVTVIDGDDAQWPEVDADTVVFTMSQGDRALERLSRWEAAGVRVVNRPDGILNCQRHRTIPLLTAAALRVPPSVLVRTAAEPVWPAWATAGVWVKRGDVHATDPADVVFAPDSVTAGAALRAFHDRGIGRAVLQQHAPGMVLKFYAVTDRFFFCVPPADAALPAPDVLLRVRELGARAARVLGVELYGGDCVVAADHQVSLIDLNDWPSYAACRVDAATSIAACVLAPKSSREQ